MVPRRPAAASDDGRRTASAVHIRTSGLGNEKPGRATPTIVYGLPSIVAPRPTIVGSLLNRSRQPRWLRTMTAAVALVGRKESPERRRFAEQGEQRRRQSCAVEPGRLAGDRHRVLRIGVGRELFHRLRRLSPGVVGQVAEHRRPQRRVRAGVLFRQPDEPLSRRIGKRPQQHPVDDRKNRAGGADSERERQQPGCGKAGVPPHHRQGVTDVPEQSSPWRGTILGGSCSLLVATSNRHPGQRTSIWPVEAFAILFTLLGIALFISIAGFAALYLLFGREPAVPSNATLVLRVGGYLTEVAPDDVVGYLRGSKTPTVRCVVENLRKAKVDSRIRAVLLKPTGFESPFWGKVQEVRDAMLDFKKSGKPLYAYLEYGGDREYYLATAADKVFLMPSTLARSDRRRDLPAVPARHARQDRRLSGSAPHRRLQDRGRTRSREKGYTAGAQGDGRVAQPRSVRADRRAASPTAGRRTTRRSAR